MKTQVLLVGCGNEYRGDDGAGLYAVRCVQERAFEHIDVRESSGEGASLIDAWSGYERVILIDAVCSGSEAGKIHRIEAHREALPTDWFRYSTHAFGAAEAIELARVLNRLPPRFIVYGIEGRNFEAGITLSAEVKAAAKRVIDCVLEELSRDY